MTSQEILNYLNSENAAKSANSKLTRIYFVNGEMATLHFYKESQDHELISWNRWRVASQETPNELFEIDGEMIESLKGGTSATL
jgi:hypothetical protein